MENYANGTTEDEMISYLSYKIDPTANYVVSRSLITYYPQGANEYKSDSGSRVLRFTLSGNGQYLDPATVRVQFTLVNNGNVGQVLYPLGGPWSFFRRCRILSGASGVIEDIDYANRIHEQMHMLTAKHHRNNDLNIEGGFGGYWDSDNAYSATTVGTDTSAANLANQLGTQITYGSQRTVSFKPLFGILNQNKYIPLQWLPLTIEYELVTSNLDAIATSLVGSQFALASQGWIIQDCQIKADVLELDSAVHNEYAAHLMNGQAIPINYCSYITQLQQLSGSTIAINIVRSCSRLKSVFVTFDKAVTQDATNAKTLIVKPWNHFYHPMNMLTAAGYNWDYEMQFQMLIGNRCYPVMPMKSGSEEYVQLKKACGLSGSNWHSISIDTLPKYLSDHFIIGIDTEKVLGATFSGVNCRQDLITIQAKAANGASFGINSPDQIYITLVADYVVEIRETGSIIID